MIAREPPNPSEAGERFMCFGLVNLRQYAYSNTARRYCMLKISHVEHLNNHPFIEWLFSSAEG